MAEETKTYNQVENGVYDCVLTGWAKRADKQFGRDAKPHYILQIGIRKADDENAQMFVADLPLVFTVGHEWGFWDENSKVNVVRKTTAKDTDAAIDYARKCLPDWAEFVDGLPEGTNPSVAFAWFGGDASVGAKCRAKLTNRTYSVNGEDKIAHEARLYEVKSFSVVGDDFDAAFGKSLKAAGVKFGKAAKPAKVAHATVEKTAAPTVPAAPSAPMPPAAPSQIATRDDAWKAYADHRLGHGWTTEQYWPEVEKIVGKPLSEIDLYTSEDWRKCVAEFVLL